VELEPNEAARARLRLTELGIPAVPEQVLTGDFFTLCRAWVSPSDLFADSRSKQRRFNAILGNPPFIRYQNFPKEYQENAFALMRAAGLQPNRLTNTWVPFLVVSTLLLEDHGRLAMVIPAELLQVNYAARIREFLCRLYGQITLVSFHGLLFEGTQQEVILFLGDRNGQSAHGIRTIEVSSGEELRHLSQELELGGELKPLAISGEKWTQYFLSSAEISLLRTLRAHPQLTTIRHLAEANVGIVTGENKFFVLAQRDVERYGLQPYVRPIVSRSAHLRGLCFTQHDWEENVKKQVAAHLFLPPETALTDLPDAARAYITAGETQGFHLGFKCRIRTPWYQLRSTWVPDAFMLRQVHAHPKIVLNQTAATCTDTIHRLRFRDGIDGRLAATAFINSLAFAFAELTGRSYGGGVLTFEPREAESIPMTLAGAEEIDMAHIDALLRANRITTALDITDRSLLIRGLGLSTREAKALREIWVTLRDRRINRTHRSAPRDTHTLQEMSALSAVQAE
jgi:adenine-specific DNA-methyltransferase